MNSSHEQNRREVANLLDWLEDRLPPLQLQQKCNG